MSVSSSSAKNACRCRPVSEAWSFQHSRKSQESHEFSRAIQHQRQASKVLVQEVLENKGFAFGIPRGGYARRMSEIRETFAVFDLLSGVETGSGLFPITSARTRSKTCLPSVESWWLRVSARFMSHHQSGGVRVPWLALVTESTRNAIGLFRNRIFRFSIAA